MKIKNSTKICNFFSLSVLFIGVSLFMFSFLSCEQEDAELDVVNYDQENVRLKSDIEVNPTTNTIYIYNWDDLYNGQVLYTTPKLPWADKPTFDKAVLDVNVLNSSGGTSTDYGGLWLVFMKGNLIRKFHHTIRIEWGCELTGMEKSYFLNNHLYIICPYESKQGYPRSSGSALLDVPYEEWAWAIQ
jgi:hypothetical protein